MLNSSSSDVSDDTTYHCQTCAYGPALILARRKTFSNYAQYKQHLESRKHAKATKNTKSAPALPKKTGYTGGKPKSTLDSLAVCLFCNHDSETLEKNLGHMMDVHTFALPYSEQLKDKTSVLRYLAEKIHIGNICLGCNNIRTGGFRSSQSVQQHMQDKGHTFLDMGLFREEYANFVKHKDQFLRKCQPMTGRISAIMTMKEIEEMKKAEKKENLQESKDLSGSQVSVEFTKVSAEDSQDVESYHSSSSISSGPAENHPAAKEQKQPEKKKEGKEGEWEDVELHDVDKSSEGSHKNLELLKESSLSMSEVSSVSAESTADEHILLDTGELLLSNGKL